MSSTDTPPGSQTPVASLAPPNDDGHFGALPFGTGHANLEFLKTNLPAWYLSAPKALREALRQSQLNSLVSHRTVEPIRSRLTPIEAFATPLLEQALVSRFGLALDVTANQLVTMHHQEFLLLGVRTPLKQSLLQAALQNFEAAEAQEGGFERGSALLPASGLRVELIYDSGSTINFPRFRYRYDGVIDIKPEQFAELSRTLDLGGQYQTHLDSVFKPATPPGQAACSAAEAVATAFMSSERDAVAVLAHIARMKDHLTAGAYDMVLEMDKPGGIPRWSGKAVRYRQLHMLDTYAFSGSSLSGVLLIEPDEPGNDLPCVVYMPGEPDTPIKEYASFTAFTDVLRRKLLYKVYQDYFQRFVSLEQSHLFFKKLNERLTPLLPVEGDTSGMRANMFDETAQLYLQKREIDKPPFELLYEHLLTKTYSDSRVIAVPTSDEDQKTRLRRWQAFESAGMDLLFVAGFFVPVLGTVMAVVATGQLLHEAFVAVEDWTHGECEEALNHVFEIGENLAQMAAFAGAVHLAPRVLPSTFIESLAPVKLRNGLTRLWKPEVASFQQKVTLPKWTATHADGRIEMDGKTWLQLEGKPYRITFDPALNKWRIEHPTDANIHSPVLEENGSGAWRHEGENLMGWDETTLFKRLKAEHETFSDEVTGRLLRITGADEGLLRQVHGENMTSPALLSDTVHRFTAEQQVEAFITNMGGQPNEVTTPHIEPFLKLLTSMPRWPEGRALRLLDEQGAVLDTWNISAGSSSVIEVTYTPGRITALLERILESLSADELKTLLSEFIEEKQARILRLAQTLCEQAQLHRGRLRNELHALQSRSTDPLIKLIRRDFPAFPDVVCKELLGTANQQQTLRMTAAQRIPLTIAEQAREYMQQLRLNRANEGFYLKVPDNPDTIAAGFRLLSRLPGYPTDFALEVRRDSLTGEKLDSLGNSQSADVHHILVRTDFGYQAFDSNGNRLGQADQPFFTALLDALPGSVRTDIGLPEGAGEQTLRALLGDLAVGQREAVGQILGMQTIKPGFKWPHRLADGRVGYPMSGRLRGLFKKFGLGSRGHSPELAVKSLYPTFTEYEIGRFLQVLKTEHTGPAEHLQSFIRVRLDALAAEYETLQQTLKTWSESPDIPFITRDARRVAAFRLRNCWRRVGNRRYRENGVPIGYQLELIDLPIGALPQLSGNWDHVGVLRLEKLDLTTSETDAFLRHFQQLSWLSLRGNNLAAIPAALTQIAHLERLSLAENPLVLDELSAARLNSRVQLRSLDLGNCPVGAQLYRLTPFTHLVTLSLRACGIETPPTWVWHCGWLGYLDLRHNRIAELSEGLLRNLDRPGLQAQLHYNPISEASLSRAHNLLSERARRRIGLDISRMHTVEPLSPATLWLTDIPSDGLQSRILEWNDLQAEPDSEEFFRVLHDLTLSADFNHSRSMLTRRVWAMIDAASETSALREELFQLAAHPATCGDGVAIVFSNLEIHVAVYNIRNEVSFVDQPGTVFKLVRGLERLDEVEKAAQDLITSRRATNVSIDEAEIRLAYRVGLAKRLDLPNQPEGMLYNRLSGVTQDMLDETYTRIIAREGNPEFLEALITRDFWMDFLEKRYAPSFEPVKTRFHERMDELDRVKESGLTDEEYMARIAVIQRDRIEALNAVARKLSLDIEMAVVHDEVAALSTAL